MDSNRWYVYAVACLNWAWMDCSKESFCGSTVMRHIILDVLGSSTKSGSQPPCCIPDQMQQILLAVRIHLPALPPSWRQSPHLVSLSRARPGAADLSNLDTRKCQGPTSAKSDRRVSRTVLEEPRPLHRWSKGTAEELPDSG